MSQINQEDFLRMFAPSPGELPEAFLSGLRETDTRCRPPTLEEAETYILDVLSRIHDSDRGERSPEENQEAFERGWRENFEAALEEGITPDALRPRYFRQNKFLRYNHGLIVSENLNLEYDLFTLARRLLFAKYLSGYECLYEFGCGSCGNLLMLSEMFPGVRLRGLDWAPASADIAKLLAKHTRHDIDGHRFDMLNPPEDFEIEPGSAVFTIHALEQLGDRHGSLINFLLKSRPAIVMNYEPICEFYNKDNLWDYLALLYSQRRGYLSGYYNALKDLEEAGKVEILEARRPHLGGAIHEASLIVWRPL